MPWIKSRIEKYKNADGPVGEDKLPSGANIFARFNNWFPHLLYFIMMSWAYFVLAAYVLIMLFMLNYIGLLIFYIIIAVFVYKKLLKRYLTRLAFLRKLKKRCKRNKFRYTPERGFFQSFKYASRGVDFRLDAGSEVYFVRFLSVKRRNSSLMFWDKDTAQTVYPRQRSWVNIRFDEPCTRIVRTADTRGFGVMKIKQTDISFNEGFSVLGNKKVRKIIIIEPEPRIIYKKLPEGGVSSTGTGEKIGDYTISTPKDFLNNIVGGKI